MFLSNRRGGTLLIAALIATFPLSGCAGEGSEDADAAEAPRDAASARPTVPQGTEMTFVVDETLSTGDAERGDYFMSTLTAAAVGVDGRAVLPAGTLGRWVVVESRDDNGNGEAVLVVGLDALRADGDWFHVAATVTSTELERDAKDSDAETAAKIGIGAAMETAVALSTRGASAELRKGVRLTVRLDRGLVLDTR